MQPLAPAIADAGGASLDQKTDLDGSAFETEYAYSRAVVQGDWCFVAGTTGYDYATMSMPDDAAAQARNALATIARALEQAGFGLDDVVRTVVYLTDASDHPAIAPALREAFGKALPANSTVVTGLLRPEMKIEIEATALRRSAETSS